MVLGKQQPCFVGAGELLREAFALQCGDPWLCSRCCVSVLACRAPRAWASCLQPAARVVLSPRHLGGRRACVLPAAADGTGCLEGRIAIRYDTRGWRGALKPRHVAAPLQPPVSGTQKSPAQQSLARALLAAARRSNPGAHDPERVLVPLPLHPAWTGCPDTRS